MVRLLAIGIVVLSSAVILVPVIIILLCIFLKQHSFRKKILLIIFVLYISAVFSAVGVPAINSLKFKFEINLIPFIDILNSPVDYIKNTILNIILFIPLGFLLPIVWKEYRSLKSTILMGAGLSIGIEILQIFTFRFTDIDDLITNTIGTVLGWCIAKIINDKLQVKLLADTEYAHNKFEPFIALFITFLIMFLIQPFISGAIWNIVLSSPFWERVR